MITEFNRSRFSKSIIIFTTMKNFILFSIITLFVYTSCTPIETSRIVTIKNQYSVDIPSILKETYNLNYESSLQYQNLFQELYIIVIDEPSASLYEAVVDNGLEDQYSIDLDGYSEVLIDAIKNTMDISNISDFVDCKINGLDARCIQVEGTYENVKAYMQFCFYKGQNTYYQLMTWTLMSKKYAHKAKMDKMIESFTEI